MAARGLPGAGQRIPIFAAMAAVALAMLWWMVRHVGNAGPAAG